ncbi:MAG: hypothetical protein LBP60_03240 [Spirochaetaceae bacterium]|jgi:hypothetical protein|nr:hypothetical protein [Spirochaetaceae bacterium]
MTIDLNMPKQAGLIQKTLAPVNQAPLMTPLKAAQTGVAMKEMTDEEADYWDEYYTKNPPKVDPAKNGGFAKKGEG